MGVFLKYFPLLASWSSVTVASLVCVERSELCGKGALKHRYGVSSDNALIIEQDLCSQLRFLGGD